MLAAIERQRKSKVYSLHLCFAKIVRAAPPKSLRGFALLPLLTRPPKGACPFATWQAVRGRTPLTTSPERWGRSRASRPSRFAVAARALTPFHSKVV